MTNLQQLRADIEKAEEEYNKWHQVWCFGEEEMHGKTKEQVIALVNYFEGKYDAFCQALKYVED